MFNIIESAFKKIEREASRFFSNLERSRILNENLENLERREQPTHARLGILGYQRTLHKVKEDMSVACKRR